MNHTLGVVSRKNTLVCGVVLALVAGIYSMPALAATSFTGAVTGGTNAISGSAVLFLAMGNSGYGSSPALLAQTISATSGSFIMSGFTCPSDNPETYILVVGGNAGGGPNSAIGLMALSGTCQGLASSSFVAVNELTTVAAQWGLAQFIAANGEDIGTSPGNAVGLANAVAGTEADLVTSVGTSSANAGVPAAFLPTGSQCAANSAPNCDGLERLNSLANVLAACVMTSGPSSSACSTLFSKAGAPSTTSTLEAAHDIVTHPKRDVKAIWQIQSTFASLPYQPGLQAPPDGWELALLFNPPSASFDVPVWVALDSIGNIWIVNGFAGIVSELPAGNYNDGATSLTPAGAALSVPFAVAVDTAGNVFVANNANNSISELPVGNFDSGAMNFQPLNAGLNRPAALALDKLDNIWVANQVGGSGCSKTPQAAPCGSISELRAADYSTDGVHFAPGTAKFDALFTIALDSVGNVWTSNDFGNSVSELTAPPRTGIDYAPASAGFVGPVALAPDASNNIWVVDDPGTCSSIPCGSISKLPAVNPNAALNFSPAAARIVQPNSIAVDSNGNLWISNFRGPLGCDSFPCGSVSEVSSFDPTLGAKNFAPKGAAFFHPTLLALDASGNVWITQFGGVSELIGIAGPVLTPIQACLKKGGTVCRP